MGITVTDYREMCRRLNLDPIAGLREAPAPKEKYGRRKKEVDGLLFDSTAEARAYVRLKSMLAAGEIANLVLQPRFLLQDAFRDESGKLHRKIEYVADFRFTRDGVDCCVDVKGFPTPMFRVKEKLFRAKYPDITLEIWK